MIKTWAGCVCVTPWSRKRSRTTAAAALTEQLHGCCRFYDGIPPGQNTYLSVSLPNGVSSLAIYTIS